MCKSSGKSFISISNMLYVFFFLNSCHALHMNYRYKVMIFKDPKNFPKPSNCKRRQGLVTKKYCTLFKYLSIFAILYHGLLLVRNITQRENGLMKFTLFTYMQGSRYGLYKRRIFQTDLKYMNPSWYRSYRVSRCCKMFCSCKLSRRKELIHTFKKRQLQHLQHLFLEVTIFYFRFYLLRDR